MRRCLASRYLGSHRNAVE